MTLPENFNAPDMLAEKRKLVVGHWVIWKRLGYGRQLIEEHFCQAVRGGTVAELLSDYPFKASPAHPLLVVLAEMEVLAVSTSEERAEEIAGRKILNPKPLNPKGETALGFSVNLTPDNLTNTIPPIKDLLDPPEGQPSGPPPAAPPS